MEAADSGNHCGDSVDGEPVTQHLDIEFAVLRMRPDMWWLFVAAVVFVLVVDDMDTADDVVDLYSCEVGRCQTWHCPQMRSMAYDCVGNCLVNSAVGVRLATSFGTVFQQFRGLDTLNSIVGSA